MRSISIIIFFLFITVPFVVQAISQDEKNNYYNVNDLYIASDKKLNELYKIQIEKYKQEGGGVMGRKSLVTFF